MSTTFVTVEKRYAINGVIDKIRGLVGGPFGPDGNPGKVVAEWEITPSYKIPFDPETGVQTPIILAEWHDSDQPSTSVKVIERPSPTHVHVVPVVWISAADTDGVVHTQEFLLEEGEIQYGYCVVTIAS